MNHIHSTAIVSESAKLGDNITVEAYAIIHDSVVIGDDCHIESHAVTKPYVTMGKKNRVCSHAILGGVAQDISADTSKETWVNIGNNNLFRESSTVHRATSADKPTTIGSRCCFMVNSHVGHDCQVGNDVLLTPGVGLGGFVEVGDGAFFGGGSMVHQYIRIGALAMVGGLMGIARDVPPFSLVNGNPSRINRTNTIGIKREGF